MGIFTYETPKISQGNFVDFTHPSPPLLCLLYLCQKLLVFCSVAETFTSHSRIFFFFFYSFWSRCLVGRISYQRYTSAHMHNPGCLLLALEMSDQLWTHLWGQQCFAGSHGPQEWEAQVETTSSGLWPMLLQTVKKWVKTAVTLMLQYCSGYYCGQLPKMPSQRWALCGRWYYSFGGATHLSTDCFYGKRQKSARFYLHFHR